MRNTNVQVFNAVDASTTQTSLGYQINQAFGWSVQFAFTGSPVGTVKVQSSNDPYSASPSTSTISNWTDITGGSSAVSGSGTVMLNATSSNYNWVRFVYTATSGTGTLSAQLVEKGF